MGYVGREHMGLLSWASVFSLFAHTVNNATMIIGVWIFTLDDVFSLSLDYMYQGVQELPEYK